ncbi:hypothetical protein C8R44DRAFT_900200 [Mycena epipterygia]|nr:hypothetical protein C8R44DRAFT_900200 [Mycena epipterygia]
MHPLLTGPAQLSRCDADCGTANMRYRGRKTRLLCKDRASIVPLLRSPRCSDRGFGSVKISFDVDYILRSGAATREGRSAGDKTRVCVCAGSGRQRRGRVMKRLKDKCERGLLVSESGHSPVNGMFAGVNERSRFHASLVTFAGPGVGRSQRPQRHRLSRKMTAPSPDAYAVIEHLQGQLGDLHTQLIHLLDTVPKTMHAVNFPCLPQLREGSTPTWILLMARTLIVIIHGEFLTIQGGTPKPEVPPWYQVFTPLLLNLDSDTPVAPWRVKCPPVMRDSPVSQLQSSILLGALSLIPNHALRYTLLLITACLALLYVIHLKRPSTPLSQLEDMVKKVEEIIRDAKLYCPRDILSLANEGIRLLQYFISTIRFILIAYRCDRVDTLTWKKYCVFSRDIAECAKSVKKIRIAVQLVVEAEYRRKFTEDINQTEAILTSVRPPAAHGEPGNRVFAPPQVVTAFDFGSPVHVDNRLRELVRYPNIVIKPMLLGRQLVSEGVWNAERSGKRKKSRATRGGVGWDSPPNGLTMIIPARADYALEVGVQGMVRYYCRVIPDLQGSRRRSRWRKYIAP